MIREMHEQEQPEVLRLMRLLWPEGEDDQRRSGLIVARSF